MKNTFKLICKLVETCTNDKLVNVLCTLPRIEPGPLLDLSICKLNENLEVMKFINALLVDDDRFDALDLSWNHLSSEQIDELSKTLAKNKKLKEINLSRSEMNNPIIENFCNSMKENSSITSLELCYCKIDDQAMEFILGLISSNKKITSLSLRGNSLTQKSVHAFIQFFLKTNQIYKIDISYNSIEREDENLINQFLLNHKITHEVKIDKFKIEKKQPIYDRNCEINNESSIIGKMNIWNKHAIPLQRLNSNLIVNRAQIPTLKTISMSLIKSQITFFSHQLSATLPQDLCQAIEQDAFDSISFDPAQP